MGKINNAENYEPIMVQLSKEKTPIAYNNKLEELIENGMSKEEAEKYINESPIELEIYYEKEYGLFAVEIGAADSGSFYSPYSKEEYLEEDYDA